MFINFLKIIFRDLSRSRVLEREREKVSDAYRLLLESKDLVFSMMIMVDSFSKIFFFLSSLKLNQSARLMQRLEHRPFVVRCEASSNGRVNSLKLSEFRVIIFLQKNQICVCLCRICVICFCLGLRRLINLFLFMIDLISIDTVKFKTIRN